VFLLVFLSTFPVVIPFLFMQDITRALAVSNGIAIVMLFGTGYVFGKITGYRPVWVGICMVIVGLALVGAAIALGG
jgi:VIT1/CCC1 family predicted Fe2+/Mn2+ transporter